MFWVKNAQAIEKKRDELPRSAKSEGKCKRAASKKRGVRPSLGSLYECQTKGVAAEVFAGGKDWWQQLNARSRLKKDTAMLCSEQLRTTRR